MWCNWCWPGINLRQWGIGFITIWTFVHHPTSNTVLVVERCVRRHLKRQTLPSESLPFLPPSFDVSVPQPCSLHFTSKCSSLPSLWASLLPCSFIPQTTSAAFKTILHPEFITREMPFKKKGGKNDHPLIVRIKNNEEVQSYPSKWHKPSLLVIQQIHLETKAKDLCGANDLASNTVCFFWGLICFLVLYTK